MVRSSVGEGRGFLLANLSVGLLTDPKVLKLARLVPDEGELACTILVYLQTVLQSWQDGRRLSVAEAEGVWEPTVARCGALRTVGLIDDEERVPESAWEKYYGPALERSEKRSKAGRKGGRASARARGQRSGAAPAKPRRGSSDASAKPQQRSTDGVAAPNLTADPPSPKGEAGGGRVGQRVVAAPTRPPVSMDRLSEAETRAIEAMLDGLSENDARYRKLKAELERRREATRPPVENADLDIDQLDLDDTGLRYLPGEETDEVIEPVASTPRECKPRYMAGPAVGMVVGPGAIVSGLFMISAGTPVFKVLGQTERTGGEKALTAGGALVMAAGTGALLYSIGKLVKNRRQRKKVCGGEQLACLQLSR